jgi:DNA/RNA endonuclease YhcR with UshA esterase domain|tara:strand:+ start:2397 stop:2750 length:354 start_codon:yes stop_codon:yes gene_type:complete
MKEKTLLKIALVTSLLGLLTLYVISDNITLSQTSIEKITLENKDEMIKIKGLVNKVIDTEKVTIINIIQPQEITVVLFKEENTTTKIKENNEVEIIGKVDEYEGKLEVIAHRARIIR